MLRCEWRVAWQTDGSTPLFIASENGFVKCVQALLDGGAAINQATVGCASSMARHREGCVCGFTWELACMHAYAAGSVRWYGVRWRLWREVIEPMPYFGSWGASR